MKQSSETCKVGKRGVVVIPANLRRRLGFAEGDLVLVEEREGGVWIRRAVALPVETYTPERKAEFLLSNATSKSDYARARTEVRKLGLDPDAVAHQPFGK